MHPRGRAGAGWGGCLLWAYVCVLFLAPALARQLGRSPARAARRNWNVEGFQDYVPGLETRDWKQLRQAAVVQVLMCAHTGVFSVDYSARGCFLDIDMVSGIVWM